MLQIRLYGGSKTPAKFARCWRQQVDGVLYGQYVFNGAPQTGRASSKGVQIHNLARDVAGVRARGDRRRARQVHLTRHLAALGDDTPGGAEAVAADPARFRS